MPFRVECPFCNAATLIAEPLARAVCARCGETFAPAAYHETLNEFPAETFAATPSATTPRQIPFALLLLALAAGIAAWLVFKPGPSPAPPPASPPATTTPPLALSGLQYLPPSCSILAAIQPATLEAYAERNGTTVRVWLGTSGVPSQILDTLDRSGVTLAQIDHLAIGVTANETRLIPGVTIVLKLRQPIDEAVFLKSLHAQRKPQAGKVIYTTTLNSLLMSPVNDTTYLFGLSDDDLAMNATGKPQFAAALQQTIQERLSPASFFWLATENRDWSTASPLLKQDAFRAIAAKLAPARGVTLGLALEPDPTLKIMLNLSEEANAKALESALNAKRASVTIAREGAVLKLLAPANSEIITPLTAMLTAYFR